MLNNKRETNVSAAEVTHSDDDLFDDPPLKISRKNLKRWRGIRSGDVTTILDGENERGNYTVKKIEREREREEKKEDRAAFCLRKGNSWLSRDIAWSELAKLRSNELSCSSKHDACAAWCRDKNSFPADEEKKKGRRNWPKESRGETTAEPPSFQSRDELGGERNDDLVFTFS